MWKRSGFISAGAALEPEKEAGRFRYYDNAAIARVRFYQNAWFFTR